MKKKHLSHGFTVIEVTIVLAIAALIIVIALLAVQAVQRSQRDRAADAAAGRIITALQNYTNDNSGNAVAKGASLPGPYTANLDLPAGATPTATDPSGSPGPAATGANQFLYSSYAQCDGANLGHLTSAAATQYAVSYWSDSAGHAVCKQSG